MELIEKKGCKPQHIFIGALLVIIGVVWLLINFECIDEGLRDIMTSWPMLLVLIGGYLLFLKRWIWGSVIFLHGVIFLIARIMQTDIPYGKVVAPVAVILLGLALLLRRK